jgi:hypothetical protein
MTVSSFRPFRLYDIAALAAVKNKMNNPSAATALSNLSGAA